MSERVLVDADLRFVEDVIKAGGGDLKKCYQCSTCTVVCPLTPEGGPFPRKEMIAAQWGLKDKLVKSMDPWLCHNCNDCSEQCPRDAKPGDAMAAIRSMTISHYASPQFITKAAGSLGGALFLLLIPMLIIAGVIYGLNAGNDFAFLKAESIRYSRMLPVPAIDAIFLTGVAFAAFNMFLGVKKFLAGLKESFPPANYGETLEYAIVNTVKDIVSHGKFKECGANASRNLSHMLMMYGFLGLFVTTNLVVVVHYAHEFGFNIMDTPLPFFHPVKLIGNISAVVAFVGIVLMIKDRMSSPIASKMSTFDFVFLGVMFLTIVTGILSQVIRVANMVEAAYFTYYLHLVFVFFLLAYLPQTKFGHIIYRPVAMIYARYSGRAKDIDPPK